MEYEKQLKDKFTEIKNEISKLPAEPEKFKDHALPLARIKKIMKLDDEVQMVSGESPILFSKACELFIIELAYRSWVHTLENNRRTLQRNDISQAISNTDFYDFLLDIVHESCKKKLLNCAQNYGPNPNFQIQNILSLCNNYGPIVYIPITNGISGIIRKDFMKDYEIILKG